MATPPKPSVKTVNEDLARVWMNLEALQEQFKMLQYLTSEYSRKAPGLARAVNAAHGKGDVNADDISQLQLRLAQAEAALQALSARADNAIGNELLEAAIQAETKQLSNRLDTFYLDLNLRVADLQKWQADVVDPMLAHHTAQITKLTDDGQATAHSATRAHTRIDGMAAAATYRFNWWVAVATGLLLGVLAYFFLKEDFVSYVTGSRGKVIGSSPWWGEDNWWVVGLVALFVLFLAYAAGRVFPLREEVPTPAPQPVQNNGVADAPTEVLAPVRVPQSQ